MATLKVGSVAATVSKTATTTDEKKKTPTPYGYASKPGIPKPVVPPATAPKGGATNKAEPTKNHDATKNDGEAEEPSDLSESSADHSAKATPSKSESSKTVPHNTTHSVNANTATHAANTTHTTTSTTHKIDLVHKTDPTSAHKSDPAESHKTDSTKTDLTKKVPVKAIVIPSRYMGKTAARPSMGFPPKPAAKTPAGQLAIPTLPVTTVGRSKTPERNAGPVIPPVALGRSKTPERNATTAAIDRNNAKTPTKPSAPGKSIEQRWVAR